MNISRVVKDNYDLHQQEAPFYDRMHPEIFNGYEQRQTKSDVLLIQRLAGNIPLSVLDIGCGTGNIALKFLQRDHKVDCVDLSDEMLNILRQKTGAMDNVRFFASDADAYLYLSPSYDVICLSSVLHHLPDYNQTLVMCFQKLNPGGFLYITHEPLPRAERMRFAPLQNLLSWLGWKSCNAFARVFRKGFPQLDYSRTDIHVEVGISPDALLMQLTSRYPLQLVLMRRYRAEPLAILAWLNNVLLSGRPAHFTLVCKKT